jgi:DNA-nicking Smr family endonuclease
LIKALFSSRISLFKRKFETRIRKKERYKRQIKKQKERRKERKTERKKDRKKERLYFSRTKLDELLGLEERERYSRDRERENVLDKLLGFPKNF